MKTTFKTKVDHLISYGEQKWGINVNLNKVELHWNAEFDFSGAGFTCNIDVSKVFLKGFRDDDDGTPEPFEIMWCPVKCSVHVDNDHIFTGVEIRLLEMDFNDDSIIIVI